jgi:sugar lactone lactonase YvrE
VEYRLRADLKEPRAFRLFVKLNNKDIKGSPFSVPIRKDYNYVVDRSLQGIGLVSGGIIDGEHMFVALYSQNQIVKVRRDNGAQEQRIPVNGQPYGMVIDGDLLYVCLYNTHYIGVYRKDTGAQERMMGGPGVFTNPVGLAQDGELLYVTEHLGHRVQVGTTRPAPHPTPSCLPHVPTALWCWLVLLSLGLVVLVLPDD